MKTIKNITNKDKVVWSNNIDYQKKINIFDYDVQLAYGEKKAMNAYSFRDFLFANSLGQFDVWTKKKISQTIFASVENRIQVFNSRALNAESIKDIEIDALWYACNTIFKSHQKRYHKNTDGKYLSDLVSKTLITINDNESKLPVEIDSIRENFNQFSIKNQLASLVQNLQNFENLIETVISFVREEDEFFIDIEADRKSDYKDDSGPGEFGGVKDYNKVKKKIFLNIDFQANSKDIFNS